MRHFIVFIMLCCIGVNFAYASQKVALIIGNSQYKAVSDVLKNPVNDAKAVAFKLKELGYDTEMLFDANLGQTLRALSQLNQRVSQGGTVVIYYAGHGVQLDGQNYIVPVDASMQDRDYVSRQAIKVQELIDKLEQTQASNRIVILDACRNDPFPKQYRSGNRGLIREQLQSSSGLMILYAASPNEVADDGKGKHGVFTQALLSSLNLAGTSLPEMMDDIRSQVRKQTAGKQNPYYEGTGLSRFMFLPAKQSETNSIQSLEMRAWAAIKNSKNLADFQDFLNKYPSGLFANTAQAMIVQLTPTTSTGILNSSTSSKSSTKFTDDELMQKGMWRDPNTNVIWMRCSLGQKWDGNTCVGKPTMHMAQHSSSAAKLFNREGGFAGYTDWVVPHIEELTSLITCSNGFTDNVIIPTLDGKTKNIDVTCAGKDYQSPTLNNLIFPNTIYNNYWAHWIPLVGGWSSPWSVYFKTGKANNNTIKTNNGALRLVRRP